MSCPIGNDCDYSNCPDRSTCESVSISEDRLIAGTVQSRLNQYLQEHPQDLIKAYNQTLTNRI